MAELNLPQYLMSYPLGIAFTKPSMIPNMMNITVNIPNSSYFLRSNSEVFLIVSLVSRLSSSSFKLACCTIGVF